MNSNEDFVCRKLIESFLNLIMAKKCDVCDSNQGLFYYEECMHVICFKSSIDITPEDICPDCKKPGTPVIVSQQSLKSLACNIVKKPTSCLEEEIMPYYPPRATIKKNSKGESLLHTECRKGNFDVVNTYLRKGDDPNEQDFAGWTPLHDAALEGHFEIAKLLVEYGASVNVPAHSKYYETPLMTALRARKIEIVEFLVKKGADLKSISDRGFTVFDFCGNDYEMLRVLCLTPRDTFNYTILTIPQPELVFLEENDILYNVTTKNDKLKVHRLSDLSKSSKVNYLIMEKKEADNKYVQIAILQGVLIVELDWLMDYIDNNGLVDPRHYIIKVPGFNFEKSALNMLNRRPKLFSKLYFYFLIETRIIVNNFEYTMDDLRELVKAGDGTVLRRRPTGREGNGIYPYHTDKNSDLATITTYVIYNKPVHSLRERHIDGVRMRSLEWFVACINTFTIIPHSI